MADHDQLIHGMIFFTVVHIEKQMFGDVFFFISSLLETNESSALSALNGSRPTLMVSSPCLGVSGNRVVSLEICLHLGIIS